MVNSILNNPSIPKYLPYAALGLTGLAAATAYAGGPTALVVAGLALAAIAVVVRCVVPWQKEKPLEPFTLQVNNNFPIRWEIKKGSVTISFEEVCTDTTCEINKLYESAGFFFNRLVSKYKSPEELNMPDPEFFKTCLLKHEQHDLTRPPMLKPNERVILAPILSRDDQIPYARTFKVVRELIEQKFFSSQDKIRILFYRDVSCAGSASDKALLSEQSQPANIRRKEVQSQISEIQKGVEEGLQQPFTFSVTLP